AVGGVERGEYMGRRPQGESRQATYLEVAGMLQGGDLWRAGVRGQVRGRHRGKCLQWLIV
ncbi:hypothetical protein KCA24_33525, partial [Escherichia coli]|nr:hypothetical protein [Escherichia coli]